MKIKCKKEKDILNVSLDGRIDMTSASEIEKYLKDRLEDVNTIVFDFGKVDYLSSAGLVVLLRLKKKQPDNAAYIKIKNVSEPMRSAFSLTGFDGIMEIE